MKLTQLPNPSTNLILRTATQKAEIDLLKQALNDEHYLKAGRPAGHTLLQGIYETYAADKQITAENIIGDVVQNTSFTAQYDAGNRITAWQMPLASASTSAQAWNYDDAGNWQSTTKTIAGNNTTENRTHSVSDQITQIARSRETKSFTRQKAT